MIGSLNRIALINLQGQLVTIDPRGRGLHSLTQVGRIFQFPAWAPDGSYIAAIGNDRLGTGVFLIQERTTPADPQPLYYHRLHEPIYLYWSPDSQMISFIASHPHEGLALHVARVDEQTSHPLATGRPFFWGWTPEADRMLIHTEISSLGARLAFITPYENGQGQNLAQPGIFQAPGVARTGRCWAYAEIDDLDQSHLVVEGQAEGERMSWPHQGVVAMSWCPAARELLAFISPARPERNFYGHLRLVDVPSRSIKVLVEEPVLAFFWSPDGRYLAYLTLDRLTQSPATTTTLANRTNGSYKGISTEATSGAGPSLSATLSLSLGLVEVTTGRQRPLLTFTPVPIFMNQFLPFFDQYALSHRLWSPTSDMLVLPVMEGDTPQIVVVPIDDSSPRPITEGIIAFWSWQ